MLSGRPPSLDRILRELLLLKKELNAEGRFPLATGRRVVDLVRQARQYLDGLNEDAIDLIRNEFDGHHDALVVVDSLIEKTDADSLQVARLMTQDIAETLAILLQKAPRNSDHQIFAGNFGTARVNHNAAEIEKPFLKKDLKVKPASYLAKRSVSTLFVGSVELPIEGQPVMTPLQACAKAMLELAALEGKKGSRTANVGSYMSKTKTFREAYVKLDDAGKAILNSAMDNSGVKRIVAAVVDKNNKAPNSNKAVALWTALRKNEAVKAKLAVLLEEKKVKRCSAPVLGDKYN